MFMTSFCIFTTTINNIQRQPNGNARSYWNHWKSIQGKSIHEIFTKWHLVRNLIARYKRSHQTCSSIIRSTNKKFHRGDSKGRNYNDPVFFYIISEEAHSSVAAANNNNN